MPPFIYFVIIIILMTMIVFTLQPLIKEYNRKMKLLSQFATIDCHPIFGNLLSFLGSHKRIFYHYGEFMKTLPSPIVLWLVNIPIMGVYDPDNYKRVAAKCFVRGRGEKAAKGLASTSLIATGNMDTWKKHRRFLTPAMDVQTLASFIIKNHNYLNEKLVEELREVSDTGITIDLWDYIRKWEFHKLHKTAMRKNKLLTDEQLQNYFHMAHKCMSFIVKSCYIPWLFPEKLNDLIRRTTGINEAIQHCRNNAKNTIIEYDELNKSENFNEKGEKVFMDYIRSAEGKELYDDESMTEEVLAFLEAGYVTSAYGISFTLLALAIHTKYQDILYEEIKRELKNKPITNLEQLEKLTFLEQCINESLRLFPPAPVAPRISTEDVVLKDGRVIPKGTNVILLTIMMHRNPNLFLDPECWNPRRFDPEYRKNIKPNSFAPFGLGPRQCIGYKYSYLDMKIMLVCLIRNFEFSSNMTLNRLKIGFSDTIINYSGFKVQVKKRQ